VVLASASPDAAAVPVNSLRRSTMLVAVVAALGSRFGAQRGLLQYGLKAGHHAVRVETGTWAPRDTGRYPVVIFAAGGPAALERSLPEYLASHGYTVVRAPATNAETVARQFSDSTAVAIISWGTDSNAVATVVFAAGGPAAAQLSIRVVRRSDSQAGRLHIVLPVSSRPGAESRGWRMLCAVTQAILNATLQGVHPTVAELADRLRAAGVREAYIRAS